jgi:4-aminobutyrate aminotransferase-like enzyme
MTGADLPALATAVPGPRSEALVDVLARHECPAVTHRRTRRAAALGLARADPIVWQEAVGANVRDADGNVFVDLTSGFGVALVGHRNPDVVAAATQAAASLPHALGDACPDVRRIELLADLAATTPDGLEVALLGLSGSDAVDAAVRTARLATGRARALVFEGAYHGLALGVAGLQTALPRLTAPFRDLFGPEPRVCPWGAERSDVRAALDGCDVGLVLVEPMLGRGGIRPPPIGWLAAMAEEARRAGALLCFDEIQTGLGRTGDAWMGTAEGVVPDLLLTGKALGGGFPLSAAVGRADVMAAWGASAGEALLTQTFLGHPVGCAAARVVLAQVRADLPARCKERGERLAAALGARGFSVRGRGLMAAAEVGADPLATSRRLLQRGWLALPAGDDAIGLLPPASISDAQIAAFADALAAVA